MRRQETYSETLTKRNRLDRVVTEIKIRNARKSLEAFTKYTLPKFEAKDFHKKYYYLLYLFAIGYIKKLMVTMPPQHGKSEGSTRRLPAFMLGLNPDLKIAIASYNDTFASKFNRDVQRIIDSEKYSAIFPDTFLSRSKMSEGSNSYIRTTHEFEVINKDGGLKSVGRGGPLTGNTVDIMIMDDLYKDYMEGNSPVIRQAVWDWYTSVVLTRLHNDSQQLIVFTRWHEDDLIGKLEEDGKVKTIEDIDAIDDMKIAPDEWVKVNFEALKESEPTPIDPREKGTALWPEKHSKRKLLETKRLDKEKFECLHQGNPSSKEGQLYDDFKTRREFPEIKIVKNYTDTADTGEDKLCSIVYGIPLASSDKHIYILDVIYTDKPMEVTEPMTIDQFDNYNVDKALIESNNGGRSFARVIKKGVRRTSVKWFHQSGNKEARIYSNSAQVNDRIVMPVDWFMRWPGFYKDLSKYKKMFKANKFHDGPDVLTGIIEIETKKSGEYDIR
jgi:predicted phage terminase large subunit-like protein